MKMILVHGIHGMKIQQFRGEDHGWKWDENDANGIVSWNIQGFISLFSFVFSSSIIFCRFFSWKSLEGCQTFAVDEGRFLVSDARSFSDVLRTGVPWSSSVAVYKKFGRRKHIFHLDIQKTSKVIQTKFFNSSFTLSNFGNL